MTPLCLQPRRPGAPSGGAFVNLDELVIAAGGRNYLAKDSRLTAGTFRKMYPRLDDFLRVRNEVDPQHVFTSDLSRRLKI